jgi:hypothetical protein
MTLTKIQRCKCGHPKKIHLRMYREGPGLPQICNYPACKCKQYTPVKDSEKANQG